MQYWLMKSEPSTFSIDDLAHKKNQTEHWDGVRNYQARNFLRDDMKQHDLAFFYHSSCEVPGIVGIVEIVKAGYPDFTAFDPTHDHFDTKSNPTHPTWFMVDVKLKEKFKQIITLEQLKNDQRLSSMKLLQRGNRLSVMPVSKQEWQLVLTMR